MIWLIALLLTKHFIVDFPLQPRWMWANKGAFGHPGGIAHAGLHGAATLVILLMFLPPVLSLFVALAEAVAHYLIDWAKMNLSSRLPGDAAFKLTTKGTLPSGLSADTTYQGCAHSSPYFWWLLGLDQWLHGMCYVAIIWFAMVPPIEPYLIDGCERPKSLGLSAYYGVTPSGYAFSCTKLEGSRP